MTRCPFFEQHSRVLACASASSQVLACDTYPYTCPLYAVIVPATPSHVAGSACIGLCVGREVGAWVGDAVGRSVGAAVGALVGDVVGRRVGRAVGEVVGAAVGRPVGSSVGNRVGFLVGDLVGLAGILTTRGVLVGRLVAGALVAARSTAHFVFVIMFFLQPFLCFVAAAAAAGAEEALCAVTVAEGKEADATRATSAAERSCMVLIRWLDA